MIIFRKLGKDVQETIKYVATFWNAVNLKYSKVESPKIKVIITGLIIAKVTILTKFCFNTYTYCLFETDFFSYLGSNCFGVRL